MSLQWLTEERIANTQQVWSRAYGREVCRDEAIEILLNVRRLAEVVLKHQDTQESL